MVNKNKNKKINKKNYSFDAKQLLFVIGKSNIITVTHCQTRLRFVLKDIKKVDVKKIEKIPSVKGTFVASGQFQVIIGVDVADFYKEFEIQNGGQFNKATPGDVKKIAIEKEKEKKGRIYRAVTMFSEIFIPLIPLFVAGGLILAFRNILELDWTGNGDSAVNSHWFWAELNKFLWIPANAIFWYIPVMVVWSIFNRKKVVPALGIAIGIMIVAPDILVNMYSISGSIGQIYVDQNLIVNINGIDVTLLSSGIYTPEHILDVYNNSYAPLAGVSPLPIDSTNQEIVDAINLETGGGSYIVNNIFDAINATNAYYFGIWPLAISYVGQVIPALLVGIFALWFYQLIERHTNQMIKYVWPPFITILVVLVFAHGIIGPLGASLSFGVTYVYQWAFTDQIAKYIVAPILASLYPVIVITGLHHMFNAVAIELTASQGGSYIFNMIAMSNVMQGAAVFGVVWITRKNQKMKELGTPAGVTCWLGVTEPAMYGVTLKFGFPFIAAMIGNAIAILACVSLEITTAGIGMGGILGFLNVNSIVGGFPQWSAWLFFIGIMIGCSIFVFYLTILLSKWDNKYIKKFATGDWEEIKLETQALIKKEKLEKQRAVKSV